MSFAKRRVEGFLRNADIEIGGSRPGDIAINDERVFRDFILRGSLGAGESYMRGWWDARNLDVFFEKAIRGGMDRKLGSLGYFLYEVQARLLNMQSKGRAKMVGETHYDLDPDMYEAMLGPTMAYTSGIWEEVETLDAAQNAKLERISKYLAITPGMKILDIGCGWGTFLKYAGERGAKVHGITISTPQAKYARNFTKGLPVSVEVEDYRDITSSYDAVVSIEMIEAVGHKNTRRYFECVRKVLPKGGRFMLQAIVGERTEATADPWLHKYIFPNGVLPSFSLIAKDIEGLFSMVDVKDFGLSYDKTLMAWMGNFEKAWPKFETRHGEKFHRMWTYYLMLCAGSFRAKKNTVMQILLEAK